ncbi:MAG: hypothetical protein ACOX8W_07800 [bacterium]|jgi:hypothetical protein
MHLYLSRLYIQDPFRKTELETDKAGVTCDGSDHDLRGWVVDAYFPAETREQIFPRDFPMHLRLVTVEGLELFGRAIIRKEAVIGSEIYLLLAGVSPLADAAGNSL